YQGIGIGVQVDKPPDQLDSSEVAVRWSDAIGDLNYTLNYFYTWTPFMFDYPNTGSFLDLTGVIRKAGRLNVVGGSWDYPFYQLPGPLRGLVWRGETALQIDDLFVNGDPNSPRFFFPDKVDHLGLMMGFDNNYNVGLIPGVPGT